MPERASSNDNNGDYMLRWPKCVDYIGEYKSPGTLSTFMPCSASDARNQDQGNSDDGQGFSSRQPPTNKADDPPQDQKPRANMNNDPYKPSRCYPFFWASDEIRLLQLDSAPSDSILHGAFTNVRIGSDQAQYEAVSYTWADDSGESTRCRPMFVGPFWDIIPMTRNCENALRSVRISGGPPRNIWIDSLCINQDDNTERSNQVALMPRIYAGATGVLVYLGTNSSNSDLAIDAMARSENKLQCVHLGPSRSACPKCRTAIKDLFRRPFFQRLWVVQEVTLARSLTMFCGSKSTYWPDQDVTDLLRIPLWDKHEGQRDGEMEPGLKLLDLIAKTRQCYCSEDRDRVFALLGMVHGLEEGSLTADYSLTSEEVSIGIASFLVQKCGRGREVLLHARPNETERRQLPSWVPDFSEPLNPDKETENLIDRSRVISEDSDTVSTTVKHLKALDFQAGVRRRRFSLPAVCPPRIQVHSRTASLRLHATRLCNLKRSFKPVGTGRDLQPFVRHGSTQRAVVLVPEVPSGFTDPSGWSSIVSPNDGLYWLHGIEGFAILRPEASSSHRLICGCDVYFEAVESWIPTQPTPPWPPAGSSCTWLQSLSESDKEACSIHLHRLYRKVSASFGNAIWRRRSVLHSEPIDQLLDIACMLRRFPQQVLSIMWESWKSMEKQILPFFQCEQGLNMIRETLKGVALLQYDTTADGRPLTIHAFQDCYMESFDTIQALIGSILSTTEVGPFVHDWDKLKTTSNVQVLKGLREWADLTMKILATLDGHAFPDSVFAFLNIPWSNMQRKWDSEWATFRDSTRGLEPALLYARQKWGSSNKSLWDWNAFKANMKSWEAFWKAMEEDTWLSSWCFHDEQDFLEKELRVPERQDQTRDILWPCTSNFRQPNHQTSGSLERQMAFRLWLRQFDFNIDSLEDVEIK